MASQEELRRAVGEAVLALDEPYRATIWLRFREQLPPREVARRMGVPVETVRTRSRRALHELRLELDRSYGDRQKWVCVLAPVFAGRLVGTTAGGLGMKTVLAGVAAATLVVVAGRAALIAGAEVDGTEVPRAQPEVQEDSPDRVDEELVSRAPSIEDFCVSIPHTSREIHMSGQDAGIETVEVDPSPVGSERVAIVERQVSLVDPVQPPGWHR